MRDFAKKICGEGALLIEAPTQGKVLKIQRCLKYMSIKESSVAEASNKGESGI